jgi:hypothetical protein
VRGAFGIGEEQIGGPRYMPAGESDTNVGAGRGVDIDVEDGEYHGMALGPIMQEVDAKKEGIASFRWPSISSRREIGVDEHGHGRGEDDPFLVPPPTQHGGKSRSSKSMRSVMSNATSLAFLELYESDEEALNDAGREGKKKKEDVVPWETLRHKSIKRGILEQVRKDAGWVDSLRGVVGSSFSVLGGEGLADTGAKIGKVKKRHAHVRGDSDLRIEDLIGGDGSGSPNVLDKIDLRTGTKRNGADTRPRSTNRPSLRTLDSTVSATASRANSSRAAYSTISTPSEGNGFRILTESPLPRPPELHSRNSRTSYASRSHTNDTPGDSGYWWWGEASANIDRYTPMPTRGCMSRSQSRSQSTSPAKGGRNAGPLTRDVLPQSPPRIMSPMLEDRLCFTPSPGQSTRVDPVKPTSPWGWGVGVGEVSSPTLMPKSRAGVKEKNKEKRLHSPRPRPLPLPFPRDPDRGLFNSPQPKEDIFRGRLVKQHSPSKQIGLSRNKTSSGRPVYADGEEAAEALRKVGEIVKQSWSTRELQLDEEGVRSLSPTHFGRKI